MFRFDCTFYYNFSFCNGLTTKRKKSVLELKQGIRKFNLDYSKTFIAWIAQQCVTMAQAYVQDILEFFNHNMHQLQLASTFLMQSMVWAYCLKKYLTDQENALIINHTGMYDVQTIDCNLCAYAYYFTKTSLESFNMLLYIVPWYLGDRSWRSTIYILFFTGKIN